MNEFAYIFITVVTLATGIELWLTRRQAAAVRQHRSHVPAPFHTRILLATHQRAADYADAKLRFERAEIIVGVLLVMGWTLGGGLNTLATLWGVDSTPSLWRDTGYILTVLLVIGALGLPLEIYRAFVIETRFGFNRVTAALYISDLVKHTLIFVLLGGPLVALLLWLLACTHYWWLWGWTVWLGFVLLMLWAYPSLIAPLFNRFTPLADAALRQRIEALLQHCGFASGGVFVMDGSKRSQHGNAYFTGLGAQKRIVFFDTLLRTLSPDEIEAVLAHELGHFKHGHVKQRLLFMAVTSLAGFALLGWLSHADWFYQGLGVDLPSHPTLLLVFLLVMPYFTALFHPLSSYWMRRHEFEADAYAAAHSDPRRLVDALVKLYEGNAITLTPDPLYSAYHDSHPPAPARIARLLSASA